MFGFFKFTVTQGTQIQTVIHGSGGRRWWFFFHSWSCVLFSPEDGSWWLSSLAVVLNIEMDDQKSMSWTILTRITSSKSDCALWSLSVHGNSKMILFAQLYSYTCTLNYFISFVVYGPYGWSVWEFLSVCVRRMGTENNNAVSRSVYVECTRGYEHRHLTILQE